jgi:hypothetical protein
MLHFTTFASTLLAGVTHLPRRRDPPGFWDSYREPLSQEEFLDLHDNSGVEWWIVVIAAAGLIYIAFTARSFIRLIRDKRERRRHRTIRPISGPEEGMRQFKDYRKRK